MKAAILILFILSLFFGALTYWSAAEEEGQAMPIGFLFPAFLSGICAVGAVILMVIKLL